MNETSCSCCCPKRAVLFNTSVVVVVEVLNRRNYAKIVEVGISGVCNAAVHRCAAPWWAKVAPVTQTEPYHCKTNHLVKQNKLTEGQ